MTEQELVARAFEAQKRAYAPYSGFPVGAALLCGDGAVFTGCNVENAAYGCTVCAERVAALKAVSEGRREGWLMLAVAGTGRDFCWPCVPCRQVLHEFCPDLVVLAANGAGEFRRASLSRLLPRAFGPEQLSGA
ncbi:MAG: cytidine deaminase [Oscillospiraceae bacterium]|nr:cytidine deaminase [Oscillospiraceae bacterium]